MAGHSQFKNIMYRKGAQDKKRSQMFSKLSKEITVAAKCGAPDPDMKRLVRQVRHMSSRKVFDAEIKECTTDQHCFGEKQHEIPAERSPCL